MSSSFMLKMHSPSWMNSIDSTSARCFGNKAPASACICLATKFLPVAIDLTFGFVIFSIDLQCSFLILSLVNDKGIIIKCMHYELIFCLFIHLCTELILYSGSSNLVLKSRMTVYTRLGGNLVLFKNLAHILVGGCLANGIGADVNEMIQLFK